MAATLQANTPLAEQLSGVLQPKLVDLGWSSGGGDDSALAEYIVLMLVNGKTQDQIASELSNDLLNLGPEDTGAHDFAAWLFQQVELLTTPVNLDASAQATAPGTQSIPSLTIEEPDQPIPQSSDLQDADMDDAMDGATNGSMYVYPRPNSQYYGIH